ncbi:hypothetical protein ACFFIR_00850 [Microbacterium arthrosphaerae]|uniref:antitoxin VbhA family protein n=1 Tax=Microbacterium TaxID=33882 RepID=UPI0035EE4E5B
MRSLSGHFAGPPPSSKGVWLERYHRTVDEEEVRRRRRGVEKAFACARLDGVQPSAAALADAESYIRGARTLDELIDDVVARHTRS